VDVEKTAFEVTPLPAMLLADAVRQYLRKFHRKIAVSGA